MPLFRLFADRNHRYLSAPDYHLSHSLSLPFSNEINRANKRPLGSRKVVVVDHFARKQPLLQMMTPISSNVVDDVSLNFNVLHDDDDVCSCRPAQTTSLKPLKGARVHLSIKVHLINFLARGAGKPRASLRSCVMPANEPCSSSLALSLSLLMILKGR